MGGEMTIRFDQPIPTDLYEELEDLITCTLSREDVEGEVYSGITGNTTRFYKGKEKELQQDGEDYHRV